MKQEINHQGKTLIYELSDKPVKNINLRIQRDGEVVVSKNKQISLEQVEEFLKFKWDWIFEAIDKMKRTQRIQSRPTDLDSVRFFGKVYAIVEKSGSSRMQIESDIIYFYSNQTTIEKKLQELQKLLEKKYISYVEEKSLQYNQLVADYGIASPQLKYRYMKGKWGSCETKKGIITMSYNLMYYPAEAIDYVLLHEYAHLIVPNHSKRFHDFLKYHMPNYKKYEDLLKG